MEKGKMEEKEGGGVEGGDEERKDGRRGGGGGEGRERGDGKEEGKGGGGRVGGKGGEVKMEVEEEKVEMFWRGNHPVLTRAKDIFISSQLPTASFAYRLVFQE
ncbi:hypothetical protein M8J75_011153 [Diaphorina citri]|nr:hypothetical protein M8J75_011153 [Diaphorina citri]